jgi:hypothetical protein
MDGVMIKGSVIFGSDRFQALSLAIKQVAEANPRRDLPIYETPATLNFVPAGSGLPDRYFIHWDQFHG